MGRRRSTARSLGVEKLPDVFSVGKINIAESSGLDEASAKLDTSIVRTTVNHKATFKTNKLSDVISIKILDKDDHEALHNVSRAESEVDNRPLYERLMSKFPKLRELAGETDSITCNSGTAQVFKRIPGGFELYTFNYSTDGVTVKDTRKFVELFADEYYNKSGYSKLDSKAPWVVRGLKRGNGSFMYEFRSYLDSIIGDMTPLSRKKLRDLTTPLALAYFVKSKRENRVAFASTSLCAARAYFSRYKRLKILNKDVLEAFEQYDIDYGTAIRKDGRADPIKKHIRDREAYKLLDTDYGLIRTSVTPTMIGDSLACEVSFDPELVFGLQQVEAVMQRFKSSILKEAKPKVIDYHKKHRENKKLHLTELGNYRYSEPIIQSINVILLWSPTVKFESDGYE